MSKPYHLSSEKIVLTIACIVIATAFGFRPKEEEKNGFVVFTSTRDGNYEIYSMNPDGSEIHRLTYSIADDYKLVDDYNPSISPDGQKIVFTSRRDDDYEIYVMNLDGSDQIRITNSAGGDDFAAWSPDGTRIAFTSWRDGNSDIYVMNADGTSQTNITNNPADDVFPAWSPESDRIVFASSRHDNSSLEPILKVYMMNSDGTNPQLLIDTESRWPAWSPDGMKIAFVSYQNGSGELHIFDLTSQAESALVTDPIIDGKVAWSSDGTEIIFTSYIDNTHGELWRVSATGFDQIRMVSGSVFDGNADWKLR